MAQNVWVVVVVDNCSQEEPQVSLHHLRISAYKSAANKARSIIESHFSEVDDPEEEDGYDEYQQVKDNDEDVLDFYENNFDMDESIYVLEESIH